ncbi:Flp family type IVb pilin [Vibrio sp. JC009]|uniref:Flp family type IVb pilin n=1 Tax=Vibrio sp. JC009 TaxID=2912314 RepID=UPI0023B12736|nr:Flp family type IVb pilin [Vibrio sp. JC009]WED22295.1 Flp family type IVb pilin [Vibrio sp. JC009]
MLTKLYVKSISLINDFKKDQNGVTAIEYAMIGVAMAVILGWAFSDASGFGASIKGAFNTIVSEISNVSK